MEKPHIVRKQTVRKEYSIKGFNVLCSTGLEEIFECGASGKSPYEILMSLDDEGNGPELETTCRRKRMASFDASFEPGDSYEFRSKFYRLTRPAECENPSITSVVYESTEEDNCLPQKECLTWDQFIALGRPDSIEMEGVLNFSFRNLNTTTKPL